MALAKFDFHGVLVWVECDDAEILDRVLEDCRYLSRSEGAVPHSDPCHLSIQAFRRTSAQNAQQGARTGRQFPEAGCHDDNSRERRLSCDILEAKDATIVRSWFHLTLFK
jgi:hypothetical protein